MWLIFFLKIYLPLYLVAYVGLAFVLPSYRIYKQTGINPVTFGSEDNAHNYIGLQMKVFTALLAIAIGLFSFSEVAYQYLMPIPYLVLSSVFWSGFILIHLSLVWIIIAQFNLGRSWRIGIDEANPTELKQEGLYRLSRNPIFFGMIFSLLGLFLALPNLLTAICFVSAWLLIQIQVRLEEEFLLRQHGAAYLAYKTKVRRWI
ncbi:isoprenylcysteine carboxylmethyltransferase family protein [soil metagenome]